MDMNLDDLIETLDQKYGNPYAVSTCYHIQQAVIELRRLKAENEKMEYDLQIAGLRKAEAR